MTLNMKYAKLLYEEMLNDVTKNPEEWISFLNSATWTFEYSFSEQLLIYAQRPDSKAVATMDFWNKSFHRWIKKGTKAIRILKYENGKSYMQNLFDLSDTYQNYGKFKGLWQLDIERDERAYIEQLESKYGELADDSNIKSAIISTVENLVEDNIETYFEESPYLENAEQEYKDIFKELVRDSIIYAVNNRCGIQNDEYTFKLYFERINLIADSEIISIFGNACRDLTREIIRETRAFVKNRTFELSKKNVYSQNKESEKGGMENERSESNVQSSERLSDTRPTSDVQSSKVQWQVRDSEGELLKGTQTRTIRQNDSNRNIDSSLEQSTAGMRERNGNQNKRTDKERQLDRANEGTRPNEMGSNDELNQIGSGTRSNERIGASIENDDILSEIEQINLIDNLISEESKEKVVADFEEQSRQLQSFFDDNISKPFLKTTLNNMLNDIPSEVINTEENKPIQELNQFVITDDDLGVGGAKEKYRNNVEAIKLLKQLESENRLATKVTSDIIFLQKREIPSYSEPEWLHLGRIEDDISINQYFIDNPQMVLGKMEMRSTKYGRMDAVCTPIPNTDLKEQLKKAIANINAQIPEIEVDEISAENKDTSLPANLNVRNYSFTVVNNKIYYRENSKMYLQELPEGTIKRIKKLIDIRDTTRKLIELQAYDASDEEIKGFQSSLNFIYDNFVLEYGRICSRANRKAFEDDSSYYLLSSLEINDDKCVFQRKADMFFKRTIKPHREVESVETSTDALIVSISEKAKVDLDYMSKISKLPKDTLINELKGVIFKVPNTNSYVTASEYLSGNVRKKLEEAKLAFEEDKTLDINVRYLEESIPEDLQASEITAKLGATWIPVKYIQQFMFETFGTPWHLKEYITVSYSDYSSAWNIAGKTLDNRNVKVNNTFGSPRMNAYKILENTLNMKDVKVFDTIEDENGNEKRVLNKKNCNSKCQTRLNKRRI